MKIDKGLLKLSIIALAIFDVVIVLRVVYALVVGQLICIDSCTIEVKHIGCWGRIIDGICPAYSIKVREDGQVQYNGGFALVTGEQNWRISRFQASMLISEFFLYGFPTYTDTVDDGDYHEHVEACLAIGMSQKCIQADERHFGVLHLSAVLDGLISTDEWIGTINEIMEKRVRSRQ